MVTHPHLVEEWDHERNLQLGLTPDNVSKGYSLQKVWWICRVNPVHRWDAYVGLRSNPREPIGCPFCANRRFDDTNSLRATHPEILEFWDYEKNDALGLYPDDFCADSGAAEVWWICDSLSYHRYQCTVGKRTRAQRNGCPYCSGRRVHPRDSLAVTHPHMLAEWDYEKNEPLGLRPEEITSKMAARPYWKCDRHHSWRSPVYARALRQTGCRQCNILKAVTNDENRLSLQRPDLAKQWDQEKNGPLTPADVGIGSGLGVHWRCEEGHEWKAQVRMRAVEGQGCVRCLPTWNLPRLRDKLLEIIDDLYRGPRADKLEVIRAHGLHLSTGLATVILGELLARKLPKRELRKFCLAEPSLVDALLQDPKLRLLYRITRKISLPLRREVYERDEYRCVHCGTTEQLSVDHIIPVILAGETVLENLQTLCKPCNSRKWCTVPEELVGTVSAERLGRIKPRGYAAKTA